DVEFVLRGSLHEHPLAARCPGHFLDGPLPIHRRPAVDALRIEVELLFGHVVGDFRLPSRARNPVPWTRQRGRPDHRQFEEATTADPQSSFSDTVFHSFPFTRVTSATGWPSFISGKTLTTRYPLFCLTASDAAAPSERFAFAMAAL